MKEIAWSKMGVVLLLIVAVAAVMQVKQQSGRASTGAPATPVSDKATGLPRMLDLGSTTCIPCKMMVSVMDGLKKDYPGKLQVDFININEDRASAKKYRIEGIPTQIFFDARGNELYRHVGFYPKDDIVAKFKELGIRI